MHSYGGAAIQWEGRAYKNDPTTGGLVRDEHGRILNQEKWHDPKIDDGTNFNVICDNGATGILASIFALSGSGPSLYIAAGSGSTSPVHTDQHLTAELLGSRKTLTNSDGTSPLTNAKVISLSTYTDNTYSPGYVYYTLATVQATWNGASDPNQNAGFIEFGIVNNPNSPASSTGTSGTLLDHYLFGSATVLDQYTTLVVTISLRFV